MSKAESMSACHNVITSWALVLTLKTLLMTWPYAVTSAAVHYGTLALMYPVSQAKNAVTYQSLAFGTMTAAHTACGNLGLQLNGVGIMELIKSTMLPATMAMQFIMYRVRVQRRAVVLGAGIVIASALSCVHDWQYSRLTVRGIGVATTYVIFNASCRVLIKSWTQSGTLDPGDLVRQQAPAACLSTAMWALAIEQPTMPTGTTWALLCLSAALAVRVNMTAFTVCSTSPTTYALLAPIKTIGVVALANDWGPRTLRPVCIIVSAALGAVLVWVGTGENWHTSYTRPMRLKLIPWDAAMLLLASIPAVPLWVLLPSACLRWASRTVRMPVMFALIGVWRVWPPTSQDERMWGPALAACIMLISAVLLFCAEKQRPYTLGLLVSLVIGTALRWSPFSSCASLSRIEWGYTNQGLTNQRSMLAGMAEKTPVGGCWLVPCMQHSLPNVKSVPLQVLPYDAAFNFSVLQQSMQAEGIRAIQATCDSPLQTALAAIPHQQQLKHGDMFDLGGTVNTPRTVAFWTGHVANNALHYRALQVAPAPPYAALHARIEDDWAIASQKHWLRCMPACAYKNFSTLLAWAEQQPALAHAARLYVSTGVQHVSDPHALKLLVNGKRWHNWTLHVSEAIQNLTYLHNGVVDAIVCANAVAFAGTPHSTFSNWVFSHSSAIQYKY